MGLVPVDQPRLLAPEALRIAEGALMKLLISGTHFHCLESVSKQAVIPRVLRGVYPEHGRRTQDDSRLNLQPVLAESFDAAVLLAPARQSLGYLLHRKVHANPLERGLQERQQAQQH